MSDKTLITPLPKKNEDWVIRINDQIITDDIRIIEIENPEFGTLAWGQRADGPASIGWYWKERYGGGVGIVIYTMIKETINVGLILQDRPSIKGDNWQIPRGFNISADSEASAISELAEETGLNEKAIIKLPGLPVNPNSTFFDTSEGDGFDFFALFIEKEMLIVDDSLAVRLREDLFKPSKTSEKIKDCRFFPWKKAIQYPDSFTGIGIARLLSWH